MKIANPAQLFDFLANEKNKFPPKAIEGSVAGGFRVDTTQLFPWLMKFQRWLSDFNDEESKAETPTAAGDGKEEKAFAEWLAENTEIRRGGKITLYRYCNKMNEWGNYTLDDIYAEYADL